MARVLVFSEDVRVRAWFDESVTKMGVFVRAVATNIAAKEWLRTQKFDLVIVDYSCRSLQIVPLFQEIWRIDPAICGVCASFNGLIGDPWPLKLAGIEVVDGDEPFEKIIGYIRKISQVTAAPERREGVLVVEDLDSPRFIISMLITSLNLGTVSCVDNAVLAFEQIKEKRGDFYCIVTDINMPEHSGLDLLRWLRKDQRTAHIPVVVLTSHATTENLFEALRAGASGFLVKPPKKTQLIAELNKAERMFRNSLSPRFCLEEDVQFIQDEIERRIESDVLSE